jgi:hypothetical protein
MNVITGLIALSAFVSRQTKDSPFSYYAGSGEELLRLIDITRARPGYRDGVVTVPVPPTGFFSGVVRLAEGDKLVGEFKSRRPGEPPRKQIGTPGREKLPAQSVQIVLYRHDVLAEGNERSSEAEWEVISINASAMEGEEPFHPDTLMANHFGGAEVGGTATRMTDAEFVTALRTGYAYWRDRAMCS